jgi:acyl carrier protein
MNATLEELQRLLRARFGRTAPLAAETDLVADLALDSLQQFELVVDLENHFAIQLDVEEPGEIRTLGELAACIERARAAP